MELERFWRLVDNARIGSDGNQVRALSALRSSLEALGPAGVQRFAVRQKMLHRAAYREDVWDAAEMMCGGCGDDSFSMFRYWLIYAGRETYEAALENPDSLAEVDVDDSVELLFEDFEFVASEAYRALTSEPLRARYPRGFLRSLEPEGEPVTGQSRREKFPRLAAKYGVGDD